MIVFGTTSAHPAWSGLRSFEASGLQRGAVPKKARPNMTKRNNRVPDEVNEAADTVWGKFRDKIAAVPPSQKDDDESFLAHKLINPDAGKSPEQVMIEKIRRRMKEYPEWYETDPDKVADEVARQLERIGEVLAVKLADAKDPVSVWQIPLSVFNWLVDGDEGVTFHRGALSAWSSAEEFNAANHADLSDDERAKLRAPFLDLAPVLLVAVLEEVLSTGLGVSFAEKFVGPELKYLDMRVHRPVA